jgi:hypothetical protein
MQVKMDYATLVQAQRPACDLERSPDSALWASDPEVLRAVHHPRAGIAIWTREPDPALVEALDPLDLSAAANLTCAICIRDPANLEAEIGSQLARAGYGPEASTLLATDALGLAKLLGELTGRPRLALRIESVSTDACRKLHADYVTYRLLTTYKGPGTQWVRSDAPDALEQMMPGWVGVLKGRLIQDPPSILHRSPPIDGTGERRLFLAIDPIDEQAPTPEGEGEAVECLALGPQTDAF